MGGARSFGFAAVAFWALPGSVWAGDASWKTDCLNSASADARLERVTDCIKTGRHVHVDSTVSRGAATLRAAGPPPAAARSDAYGSAPGAAPTTARVHVSPLMPGIVRSGLFGR